MVTAPLKTYQHVPRDGVPPDDHAREEGVALHLDVSWDDVIFVCALGAR